VDLWFRPPRGRAATYKLLDFHEVVRSGRAGDDDHVRLWLPPSYYDLRVYTKAAVLPYERVDFVVVPCMPVRVRCDSVRFTNPSAELGYNVRVRTSSAGTGTTIRLETEQSKTLSISSRSLRWKATPHLEEPSPELWDLRAGSGSVRVPTDCSTVIERSGGLADTGGPASWPLGGAILAMMGSLCLIKGSRCLRGRFVRPVEARRVSSTNDTGH
jgi:hypothetical protein